MLLTVASALSRLIEHDQGIPARVLEPFIARRF